MRGLQIVATLFSAVLLLAIVTVGALVGLNAECNGGAGECPRSDMYRATLLVFPVLSLALLVAGALWALRRRALWPLALAEAAVIGVAALADASLDGVETGDTFLFLVATGIAYAALDRRARTDT